MGGDSNGGPTSGRSRLGRVIDWLLLDGDRRLVAGLTLVAGFLVAGPLGHAVAAELIPHAKEGLANRHTTVPLVSALLSGNFLLFSIVVSVNSLFVSQEQNPLGQQFGRVQSIVQFRRSLEDVVEADHVPASADKLVRLVSGDIVKRAQYLEETLSTAEFELKEDLGAYVERLAAETGEANERLETAESTFEVLRAVMDFDHDQQINDLRRIQAEHGDDIDGETAERLDEMLRMLQYFATAREYFKTLYIRREFAALSRDLVVTMVPTAATLAITLHYLNFIPDAHLVVAAIEAIAFTPFVLVAAYVIRVAVVSRRTQTAGQFVAGHGNGAVTGIPRDGD